MKSLKEKILKISTADLEEGVVSEKMATLMAEHCRQKTGADYALSFTGYAGPTGGDEHNPIGRVWIGFSSNEKTFSQKFDMAGSRDERRLRFCEAGFHLLRQSLL